MAAYTGASRRPRLFVFVAAFFLAVLGLSLVGFHDVSSSILAIKYPPAYNIQDTRKAVRSTWEYQLRSGKSGSHAVNDTRLHVLIPANNGDVNLCKTLLTSNALGYPDPTILAWQEKYDVGKCSPWSTLPSVAATDAETDYLLGGGSHLAKISAVLDWLKKSEDAADNDLVVMMDAYG